MLLKNPYIYYNKAISESDCDRIIKIGMSKLQPAQTIDGKDSHNDEMKTAANDMTKEDLDKLGIKETAYMRDSQVAWLSDKWIYDKVLPFINDANKKAGWNWKHDYIEQIQFTKYGLNQFYGWHADGNSDFLSVYKGKPNPSMNGKVRKISVTINLVSGDEYEGGNLRFDYGPHAGKNRYKVCEEIRPKGSIIVFPSILYHQVTPITKGTRYSLVMWVLGRPWQ